MSFAEDLLLEGSVVRLRSSAPEDHAAFRRIWSDPRVMRFLPSMANAPAGWTLAQVAEREATFRRLRKAGRALAFAVEDRASGEVLGTCGFHLVSPADRCALFGLILDVPAWGTGAAAECHLLCLGHGFEELGLHRVELETDERNARMRRFLERSGVALEFVRREAVRDEDGYHDSCGYAVLEGRWPEVRAALREAVARQRISPSAPRPAGPSG